MFNEKAVTDANETMRLKLADVRGPWNDEPMREEFKHMGLDCLLQRGPGGAWCGYVAVTPGHKWFGRPYSTYCEGSDDDPDVVLEVHGGITYSESCGGKICHRTEGDDKAWWFGFDCSHSQDMAPLDRWRIGSGTYRDINYARDEVKSLAEQLAKIA